MTDIENLIDTRNSFASILEASPNLQGLIISLLERISIMEEEISAQNEIIRSLGERLAKQENLELEDVDRLSLDIAQDRKRLTQLERKELKPSQKDRADILRSLLIAHGGKMLAREARKKMKVPKSSFSELLKACDFLEKRPYHLDPRQDVLVLK